MTKFLKALMAIAFLGFVAACSISPDGSIRSTGSGGSNVAAVETAVDVAEDLGLPADAVETIDPGTPVAHEGVVDADGDGSTADEADEATAEGVTQEAATGEEADADDVADGNVTEGGNAGIGDIF